MGYLARRIAVLAVIGCSVMVAGQAKAFEWADDSMSYWYGPYFREPGVTSPTQPGGADIGKNIIEFTHADGWKYGTNFFDAQLMMSNRQDPAVATNHQPMGAYEAYVLYRSDLSLNAMTGSKAFMFGPFSDVGINSGFDWDSKNNAYGSGKLSFQVGPSVHIKVPAGFWLVSAGLYKEMNNDGYNGPTNFHLAWTAASSWKIPFKLGLVPLAFEGFVNVIGPKGYDYAVGTKTEVQLHPKLMVDIGQLVAGKKDWIEAGVGWEYWWHKFGNPNYLGGTTQSTPFVEATLHF